MKVGISNDHAAVELKMSVLQHLQEKGYEIINYGTDSSESYDYPVAGSRLAKAIQDKEVDLGIAICGTGVGISIACNKHKGIRACCCSEATSARLTREHNDANIICFGARIVSTELANDIVDTFLTTPFSNGERHKKRVQMIKDIEEDEI
jgi:ribose 5-phosphate isomerase B